MAIGSFILKSAAILGAVFCPVAAAAADKPPQRFTPSGPWAMEYADEGCRLIRNFSDGKAALTLALERFAPGVSLRVGLTGTDLRLDRVAGEVSYRFGEGGPQKGEFLETILADGRKALLLPDATLIGRDELVRLVKTNPSDDGMQPVLKAEADGAKGISALTFLRGFEQPLSLDLGAMSAPIKAMQRCVDDLVVGWGIDLARLLKAKRYPAQTGNPYNWITSRDYPPNMMKAGLGGLVRVRLIIGEDGAIAKCMVEVLSPGEFEKLVCDNLAKRAKFTPALDAEGKPMRSFWARSWRFIPANQSGRPQLGY